MHSACVSPGTLDAVGGSTRFLSEAKTPVFARWNEKIVNSVQVASPTAPKGRKPTDPGARMPGGGGTHRHTGGTHPSTQGRTSIDPGARLKSWNRRLHDPGARNDSPGGADTKTEGKISCSRGQ